ncbi:MAG: HPP family protein [Desulfarculus sp.]|nr:HPP family protein [Desulfarculus sp.]
MSFWAKLKGTTQSPPRVSLEEMAWSWLGSLLGIGAVAGLNHLYFAGTPWTLIVGSFGASASLIYGAIKSPLAQPRNFVGGQVLSALVGVSAQMALPGHPWLAAPLAVAFAVVAMHATKTLHPPGGATALIAVVGGPQVHDLGYLYALLPVGAGALLMLAIALVVNNLPAKRRYPEFWL